MKVLPLFKSEYSIGRSILTLNKKDKTKPGFPFSIIDIAFEENLKQIFLIDDSMTGFLEAHEHLKEIKVQFIGGLRLTCLDSIEDKTPESLNKEHKIIIVAKNLLGYKTLIKLYSKAATDGFYYLPRLDCRLLSDFWNDGLDLWIPFYDSYIYNNLLMSRACVPSFPIEPYYLYQDNMLPIDTLIQKHLKKLNKPLIPSKNIYYKNRSDFKKYMTYRCINDRTTIEEPQIDGLSSQEFCLESWKEQNQYGIL